MLLDVKKALIDKTFKGFTLTMFNNYCLLFWYCGRYHALCMFPWSKKKIFSWVLPLWFRLCLVCRGYRDRGWEVRFDAPFAFRIRRSSPKSKVVGRSPALLRIYKSFLILSLLTLFIEKFACPSSIMDPKAQERICRFVFTTESWQYWDLI